MIPRANYHGQIYALLATHRYPACNLQEFHFQYHHNLPDKIFQFRLSELKTDFTRAGLKCSVTMTCFLNTRRG
jgi:hypothetical protein